jgi:hypothetical protein
MSSKGQELQLTPDHSDPVKASFQMTKNLMSPLLSKFLQNLMRVITFTKIMTACLFSVLILSDSRFHNSSFQVMSNLKQDKAYQERSSLQLIEPHDPRGLVSGSDLLKGKT